MQEYDVPVYKVASACLTYDPLLRAIYHTGKPVILSTGMSTVPEINHALGIFYGRNDVALLVCTSTYPCRLDELNLSRILTFRRGYPNHVIGYSGHEVGLWTTLTAVALGANIVERHLTLDRSMWGSDQAASVEPGGMIKLVREIRDYETAFGDGRIGPIASELPVMQKLRRQQCV